MLAVSVQVALRWCLDGFSIIIDLNRFFKFFAFGLNNTRTDNRGLCFFYFELILGKLLIDLLMKFVYQIFFSQPVMKAVECAVVG